VDWAGLVREAFALTRRGVALWRLGAVSAVQLVLYTLVLSAAVVPLAVLSETLAVVDSPDASIPLRTLEIMSQVLGWVSDHRLGIAAGALSFFAVWVTSGVLDVAATAGTISQTGRLADNRSATFSQGMRDGFRAWWRTVGLLAIAAIPALISLAVLAAVTLLTITIPITQGQSPSLAAISVGSMVNSALSGVLGLVGIPLAVIAQLGMRYVVFEDAGWKSAWRSAQVLARTRLADVVVMYLVQVAVVWVCSVAFLLVAGALAAVLVVSVALIVGAAHSFSGAAFFVLALGVLALTVGSVGYFILVVVWQSVAWTLFWRRVRGVTPAVPRTGASVPDANVSASP
jgi:hypothetical protein